nr:capsid protein [Cressdnaviricota sp.]UOF82678.1 capsid protein [Cressdnaviricota sp.]
MPITPLSKLKKPSKSAKKVTDDAQTKAIISLRKDIKEIRSSEPKYLQGSIAETSMQNATPKAHILNALAQGDTNITRDGVKMRWRWLSTRHIIKTNSALTGPSYIRVMLVRRKIPKGTSFNWAELFTSSTPGLIDQFNWITNDHHKFFDVIWDKSFKMGPARVDYTSVSGHSTATPNEVIFEMHSRFNFVTDYSISNAGTVSDINLNALHLLCFTDNSTANAMEHYCKYTLGGGDL